MFAFKVLLVSVAVAATLADGDADYNAKITASVCGANSKDENCRTTVVLCLGSFYPKESSELDKQKKTSFDNCVKSEKLEELLKDFIKPIAGVKANLGGTNQSPRGLPRPLDPNVHAQTSDGDKVIKDAIDYLKKNNPEAATKLLCCMSSTMQQVYKNNAISKAPPQILSNDSSRELFKTSVNECTVDEKCDQLPLDICLVTACKVALVPN